MLDRPLLFCSCVSVSVCVLAHSSVLVCGVPLVPLRFPSIHAYVYACMHVSMYVDMSVCLHVCTYVSIFVCLYVCMHLCVYMRISSVFRLVSMHTCLACMHACMHTCMHTCIYAHIIACMCGGIEIDAYSYPYAQKDSEVCQPTASHKKKKVSRCRDC